MEELVSFPSGQVNYLHDSSVEEIWHITGNRDFVFVTDTNLFSLFPKLFKNRKVILLPPGEKAKQLSSIQNIIEDLIEFEATRKTLVIGVGGGVVTDITGFAASTYMRGIPFGFIPTTLLGMVDAAIGGKNGVNIGLHKNMAGNITQPGFILFDCRFLQTLPDGEWSNGFAEIIKYACLFDAELFEELAKHDIGYYQQNTTALQAVIRKCVDWKNKTVINDEHETGQRKLLNFGHTAAHAIETIHELSHGEAVAVGMVIAAMLSETVVSLDKAVTDRLKKILRRYNLPTAYPYNEHKVMNLLKMDKKRVGNDIDYILLNHIGQAVILPLPFETIEKAIHSCAQL